MKFQIINKKIGVRNVSVFSEFECPENIKDLCYVKKIGFVCVGENNLFVVTEKSCNSVLKIHNPMSICNYGDKVLVACNNGLVSIDPKYSYYESNIFGDRQSEEIFKPLSKVGVKDVYINSYNNVIGMCFSSINKFYKIVGNAVQMEFGTGVAEYSSSSDVRNCSFFYPKGIVVYDEDTIIISDTENGCIRSFGQQHKIIFGNPGTKPIRPKKLLLSSNRNMLYYISDNHLKSINMNGTMDSTIYSSEFIKSIAISQDDKAYILEEVK